MCAQVEVRRDRLVAVHLHLAVGGPRAAAARPAAERRPGGGVAFRVTTVPCLKLCEQVAPQAIPAGVLVTVPVPVPVGASWTVRVCMTGTLKYAVTV